MAAPAPQFELAPPAPPAAPAVPRFLGLRVTPLTRRRLEAFRRNRRGCVSLWILLGLLGLSLGAELLANDRPLAVGYRGEIYFPVLFSYPETVFGGEFETEADYLDPAVQRMIETAGGTLFWPLLRSNANTIDYALEEPAPAPPSLRHWLGTDEVGRDVLARLLYGFRLSMAFGLLLTAASSAIGISVGAVQGYFGGRVDLLLQRVIEIFSGMPVLLLLVVLASMLRPGFFSLLGILMIFAWLALVGVVRAEFLRARKHDYVRAARALGTSDWAIMRRHVLPNAAVATLTFLPFVLAGSIVTLTALDFLGLGLPVGAPSLGELLQEGKANLWAPWIGLSAFAALSLTLTLISFVSEAARDAFDPRKSAA